MLEWILVGLIVAVAALLLARSLHRAVNDTRPTCACGQVECPLAGNCTHEPTIGSDEYPDGCRLQPHEGTEEPTLNR